MLALVLGLLVYTAFTVYSTQQSEAQGLGPVVIELDDLLEQYGPDALRGRVGLREALGRSRKRFFGDPERGPQAHTFEETRATMHWMNTYFGSLEPATERQRQLRVSAKDLAKTFAETQMLMAGSWPILSPSTCSSSSPSGPPCCFSATASSRRRTRLRSAHFLGVVAVASAVFLILELSHPYSGVIRLSPRSPRPAHAAARGRAQVGGLMSHTRRELPRDFAPRRGDPVRMRTVFTTKELRDEAVDKYPAQSRAASRP